MKFHQRLYPETLQDRSLLLVISHMHLGERRTRHNPNVVVRLRLPLATSKHECVLPAQKTSESRCSWNAHWNIYKSSSVLSNLNTRHRKINDAVMWGRNWIPCVSRDGWRQHTYFRLHRWEWGKGAPLSVFPLYLFIPSLGPVLGGWWDAQSQLLAGWALW